MEECDLKKKNYKTIFLYSFSILSFSLNTIYVKSLLVMTILAIFQVILLIFLFIKNRDLQYLGFYLVFLSASMESANFVGSESFYGFKNFSFLGLNLAVWMILPVFIRQIIKQINNNGSKVDIVVRRYLYILFVITISSVFFGLFQIIINDNNIQSLGNIVLLFVNEAYIYIVTILYSYTLIYVIQQYKDKGFNIYSIYFDATIIGFVFSVFVALLFGAFGNRSGYNSLQLSNMVMLSPLLICYPLFQKNRLRISGIILLYLAVIFSVYYNANGKMIILLLGSMVLFFGILFRRKDYKSILLLFFIFSVVLIISTVFVDYNSITSVLKVQVDQVISLFDFSRDDWLSSMNASPRARIAELLNITVEYFHKPYFVLFGKGYMGSVKDHLNLFGEISLSGYSYGEWISGSFYQMHETLNLLFLSNGVMGVLVFIYFFLQFIKNFHKSFYIIFGSVWFLLFYGYSVTLAFLGVSAMILGLYQISEYNNLQKAAG